jgi:hypothetical protein
MEWGPGISGAKEWVVSPISSCETSSNILPFVIETSFFLLGIEQLWAGETSLPLPQTEPRFLGHPACSLVTILTELSRLQKKANSWCFKEFCYRKLYVNAHNGNYIYGLLEHLNSLQCAHRMYMCDSYDSRNKQSLLPLTALSSCLCNGEKVCFLRGWK